MHETLTSVKKSVKVQLDAIRSLENDKNLSSVVDMLDSHLWFYATMWVQQRISYLYRMVEKIKTYKQMEYSQKFDSFDEYRASFKRILLYCDLFKVVKQLFIGELEFMSMDETIQAVLDEQWDNEVELVRAALELTQQNLTLEKYRAFLQTFDHSDSNMVHFLGFCDRYFTNLHRLGMPHSF